MKKIANEEKRDRVPFNEANYLIVCSSFYSIYTGIELLDLYADCTSELRAKIKPLLMWAVAVLWKNLYLVRIEGNH